MKQQKWKASKDPLHRGDAKASVRAPMPSANDSIVRHVLYLEGPGRDTPYLSTSESYETAKHFAGDGSVWVTSVVIAETHSVTHIGNSELLASLKGNGRGKAKWPDAFEVMQARRYVEQWSEYLLDFRTVQNPQTIAKTIFKKQ